MFCFIVRITLSLLTSNAQLTFLIYNILDFASRWFPQVRIFQFEAWNITREFLQRAARYFDDYYYLKDFKNNETNRQLHRKEIERTEPGKYADVWLNVTELVSLVTDVFEGKASHAPMERFKFSRDEKVSR